MNYLELEREQLLVVWNLTGPVPDRVPLGENTKYYIRISAWPLHDFRHAGMSHGFISAAHVWCWCRSVKHLLQNY